MDHVKSSSYVEAVAL